MPIPGNIQILYIELSGITVQDWKKRYVRNNMHIAKNLLFHFTTEITLAKDTICL